MAEENAQGKDREPRRKQVDFESLMSRSGGKGTYRHGRFFLLLLVCIVFWGSILLLALLRLLGPVWSSVVGSVAGLLLLAGMLLFYLWESGHSRGLSFRETWDWFLEGWKQPGPSSRLKGRDRWWFWFKCVAPIPWLSQAGWTATTGDRTILFRRSDLDRVWVAWYRVLSNMPWQDFLPVPWEVTEAEEPASRYHFTDSMLYCEDAFVREINAFTRRAQPYQPNYWYHQYLEAHSVYFVDDQCWRTILGYWVRDVPEPYFEVVNQMWLGLGKPTPKKLNVLSGQTLWPGRPINTDRIPYFLLYEEKHFGTLRDAWNKYAEDNDWNVEDYEAFHKAFYRWRKRPLWKRELPNTTTAFVSLALLS